MRGRVRLGDDRRMTSNVPSSAFYIVAPDVPAGLTLNEYRRRRSRRRRRGLRRLSGLARRPAAGL
jgi:hypothetical protein